MVSEGSGALVRDEVMEDPDDSELRVDEAGGEDGIGAIAGDEGVGEGDADVILPGAVGIAPSLVVS